jgi:hypothetical protein
MNDKYVRIWKETARACFKEPPFHFFREIEIEAAGKPIPAVDRALPLHQPARWGGNTT